jgi:hypothetical protein
MKRHFLKKQLYLEKIKVLFFQFLFNKYWQLCYFFVKVTAIFFKTFLLGQQDVPDLGIR